MRRQCAQGDSPRFRQNCHNLAHSSHSVSQRRLSTNNSNKSLINLLKHKHTSSEISRVQSHHQSVFVSVEVDKENESPNYMDNLAGSRPISQVDKFRKERIRKLYGAEQIQQTNKFASVCRLDTQEHPRIDSNSKIEEQAQTVRRLEQQLRQRDRMILELQKADINKENHLVSLTSHNLTLTSTLQVLKQQTSHMASVNQRLQSQLTSCKKVSQRQAEELQTLKAQLQKKNKSIEMFSNLEPKLRELQQLQDKLIAENTSLKLESERLRSAVENSHACRKQKPSS